LEVQRATSTPRVRSRCAETPSGKIEFDDGRHPITGCDAPPLVAAGSSYIATCQTSVVASESPMELSADFLPGLGVNIKNSFTTDDLAIGLGPTTTSLQVSPATSPVNQNVALIATLSPSGPGVVQSGGLCSSPTAASDRLLFASAASTRLPLQLIDRDVSSQLSDSGHPQHHGQLLRRPELRCLEFTRTDTHGASL
jgi:hypothetical protein